MRKKEGTEKEKVRTLVNVGIVVGLISMAVGILVGLAQGFTTEFRTETPGGINIIESRVDLNIVPAALITAGLLLLIAAFLIKRFSKNRW